MKKNLKSKKNKKTSDINKKRLIIITIITLFVLFILLFSFNYNKKLVCTKEINKEGIFNQQSQIVFNLKGKKINNIYLRKELVLKNNYINYIDILKQSLENTYDDLKLNYNITVADDKLSIKITYDKLKEYTLDNVDINLKDETIDINVISDNLNKNVDLNGKYTKTYLKEQFEKEGYMCK